MEDPIPLPQPSQPQSSQGNTLGGTPPDSASAFTDPNVPGPARDYPLGYLAQDAGTVEDQEQPAVNRALHPSDRSNTTLQDNTRNEQVVVSQAPRGSASGSSPTGGNGPAGSSWTVPARPKPGRKPLEKTEDPHNRRKVQNRQAQRAFRDRRARRVQELEEAMQKMKDEDNETINRLTIEAHRYREENAQLHRQHTQDTDEINNWRNRVDDLTERLKRAEEQIYGPRTREPRPTLPQINMPSAMSSAFTAASYGQSNTLTQTARPPIASAPASAPTPPDDTEIDFTYLARPRNSGTSDSNPSNAMTLDDADCGFCDKGSFCICRNAARDSHPTASNASRPAPPPPGFLEAPARASGPGSCDACLRDPERARQCRELGQAVRFSSAGGAMLPPPQPQPDRMSCDDLLSQAQSLPRGQQFGEVFGGLQAYPRSQGPHEPAMEFDSTDAAHALASLSRRSTIISQPDPDERGQPQSHRGDSPDAMHE